MLVAPSSRDTGPAHKSLAKRIEPAADHGVHRTWWALAHQVTRVSLRRIEPPASRITAEQLASIRRPIMVAVGPASPALAPGRLVLPVVRTAGAGSGLAVAATATACSWVARSSGAPDRRPRQGPAGRGRVAAVRRGGADRYPAPR